MNNIVMNNLMCWMINFAFNAKAELTVPQIAKPFRDGEKLRSGEGDNTRYLGEAPNVGEVAMLVCQ